jgi:hypothetical protein
MAGSERSFGFEAPLGPWRPLDAWVVGYALVAALVLGVGVVRGVPGCAAQAGTNLAVAAGALALAWCTRATRNPLLTGLRLIYPMLLYPLFYHQVQAVWPVLHREPLDRILVALEFRLWGFQPAQMFQPAFPFRWLSELFCLVYLAYYFCIPAVTLTALFTRGHASAERIILGITRIFLLCYGFFWLLPTVGPHFWCPPADGPRLYQGYWFNHALFFFTSGGEIRGGAFPSSHIAVAVALTLFARRETPVLFPVLATLTLLMFPAVVYLRAHYLVDVPAGLLAGLLGYAWSQSSGGDPRPPSATG